MSFVIQESPNIAGVKLVNIRIFADDRGRFMESFRLEWFPEADWSKIQSNRSDSKAGVLRGLHYHFEQVDYWYVSAGCIRAGLVDLRPHSPTYRNAETIDIDADAPMGLFIPVGVAHGFYALTDCTLTYIVNNYYNGKDEFGVAWNDPALNLDWGIESPVLSPRDLTNPALREIPELSLPR
jgi:dTDP-4-dehydrorhamnose 3,5-epimerase